MYAYIIIALQKVTQGALHVGPTFNFTIIGAVVSLLYRSGTHY